MSSKKTVKVRVYPAMAMELKMKFPDVRSADLFQMMFDTSLLKAETALRKIRKKNEKKLY